MVEGRADNSKETLIKSSVRGELVEPCMEGLISSIGSLTYPSTGSGRMDLISVSLILLCHKYKSASPPPCRGRAREGVETWIPHCPTPIPTPCKGKGAGFSLMDYLG